MSASCSECFASSLFCESSLILTELFSLNKLNLPTMTSFRLSDTEYSRWEIRHESARKLSRRDKLTY
ncbi:hypothetical protein D1V04_00265 [Salmonella enterica]|nr:hypothetical protein [Salmonella enterica]ECE6099098.1 hypothetical protein [Salmonella enterica subsp. arizonae]ECT9554621.1 hypothetical protein [Salmonella enterica subsp. arizonae serovar 41:z4,z23:-]EDS4367742.1 hypothetical protein [Salmonella enterica subsp. enterica serovar Waycross]EBM5600455.1 hypothetical protein [Salmonella enterica]